MIGQIYTVGRQRETERDGERRRSRESESQTDAETGRSDSGDLFG